MNHRRPAVRLLSLVASLLLLCSLLPGFSAVAATAPQKVYDIAVAYDNSGSMYDEGPSGMAVPSKRWCYAKYAMEIFASMLDYEAGDKLTIFPMWSVTSGGQTYDKSGKPLEIRSKADIDKISNMETTMAGTTPFDTVEKAHQYLKKSNANEKWLLVLTDGAFSGYVDTDSIRASLKKLSSTNIKVQYLGFMGAPTLAADESDGFYSANAESGQDLQQKLVSICNQIFQRDELPADRLNGQTLTLDLSMKKLIVFVQGKDAKVSGLKGADGTTVPVTMDSGQRHYSKISTSDSRYLNAPYDNTLFGQVVTFGACAKGTYTLEHSGATQIQIFYEPDVTLQVTLTNADGEVVDPKGEMYAGDYIFNAKVVDKNTGEDVTNAPLMGGKVPIDITLKYSNNKEVKAENGSKLTLDEGQEIQVDVTATYLDKYTISNKDDPDIFPLTFSVVPKPVPLAVTATVEQDSSWYTLTDHEEWKPVRLDVLLEGQKLTDEQMQKLTFTVTFDGDTPPVHKVELLPGQSAAYVYIGTDESGSYVEPATGDYTLTATATTTDEYDREIKATATADFTVQSYPWWVPWLIGVGIFLVLLALFLLFMSKKVLPNNVIAESTTFVLRGRVVDGGEVNYDRRAATLTLKSPPVPTAMDAECKATFSLYPIDNRWKGSAQRRIGINNISGASMGVTRVSIDSTAYKKEGGRFILSTAPEDPIREETTDPAIKISTARSYFDCSLTRI